MMFTTMIAIVSVLALLVSTSLAQPKGLELSLQRTSLFHKDDSPCSQLICRVKGNSDSINSVTVRKVKVGDNPSDLLAVTTQSPETDIRFDNIRANGTLHNNSAVVFIDLTSESSCQSDLITCEVNYTTRSGLSGETFTLAGPGRLPNFQQDSQTHTKSPVTAKAESQASTFRAGSPYVSELWFLGEKITKVEAKFSTLSDRLEERLRRNTDAMQSRAGTLENTVLERVSAVETDFSSRVSRLEDRVSAILLAESSGDTRPGMSQDVSDLERRLGQMEVTLDQMNVTSTGGDNSGLREHTPAVCERGMGDDVTKTYPRYVMTYDATIKRQVLCETQRIGGGWIVIQRRAFGDADFYRDWTSYREGFGSLSGDFYIGNDNIHLLSDENPLELRIDFRINGQESYAEYSSFRIEDETNKYRLRLGSYSGTVGEAAGKGFSSSNNKPFSTFDRDNDDAPINCAIRHHGAWWYTYCHNSNLNGIWLEKSTNGVSWYTGSTWVYPDFTEMKVRPNSSS